MCVCRPPGVGDSEGEETLSGEVPHHYTGGAGAKTCGPLLSRHRTRDVSVYVCVTVCALCVERA